MKTKSFLKPLRLVMFFWVSIFAHAQTVGATFVANGIKYSVTSATAPLAVSVIANSPIYSGSVTIPSTTTDGSYTYNVTSIVQQAFYGCTGLTSVTIPNSVTSIGISAFQGCTALTSVTLSSSLTSLNTQSFMGCTGLVSIVIPNSVTSIGSSVFYNCTGLTSATIGSSVISIGSGAFYGCSGLTSIGIPSSVTSIGSSAFANCSHITSVTFPSSVTSIADYAFWYCTNLANVTSLNHTPPTLGASVFPGIASGACLHVPSGYTSAYTTADAQYAAFSCINNNLATTEVRESTTLLYPNPAKDFVTLNNLTHGADISVLDMSGKLLYHTKATDTTLTINTSSYAKGVYLVNVDGKVSKLVVEK